ncbi:hypothetical protein [Pseudomonas sp. S37]|uniref:hypothetical protein n=1 Tax=Pseudomonas sp. S37 TaxID=2767449 RepID=UPI001911B92B|nr:hypothetical protein [Pseudomonas sp. S37]
MDDWRTDSGDHPDCTVHALTEVGAALAALNFFLAEGEEHALGIAVDDRGTDSGDHPDLVVYALRFLGPLCGPSRHKAAPTGECDHL